MLTLNSKNDVHIRIDADRGILLELSEYFSFYVPNHYFIPSVRRGQWDGKIRLLNVNTREIYKGLIPYIYIFAKEYGYKITNNIAGTNEKSFDSKKFFELLNPHVKGKSITPRDYQYTAVEHGIANERCLLLSPTSSGKSLIIYALLMYYFKEVVEQNKKLLIIVPTKNLCLQMFGDFKQYSEKINFDPEKQIHIIMEGAKKQTGKNIVVSTWQAIFKMGHPFFKQFGFVLIDECHLAKSKSMTSIMEKLIECPYRFGTTGTLDGSDTHKLILEGLFGRSVQVATTKKLMDAGHIANLKINSILLQYPEDERKAVKKMKYQEEISYITQHTRRNNFIKKLALSRTGNVLILFNFVVKHGKSLFESLSKNKDHKVYYVHGNTTADDREKIRSLTEQFDNIIIVASLGVMSTGANIKNLQTLIFAHPSKGEVRNLQSIGRVLRLDDKSNKAVLFDIADDLSHKKYKNYGLKHWEIRIGIYNKERLDYSIIKINI